MSIIPLSGSTHRALQKFLPISQQWFKIDPSCQSTYSCRTIGQNEALRCWIISLSQSGDNFGDFVIYNNNSTHHSPSPKRQTINYDDWKFSNTTDATICNTYHKAQASYTTHTRTQSNRGVYETFWIFGSSILITEQWGCKEELCSSEFVVNFCFELMNNCVTQV